MLAQIARLARAELQRHGWYELLRAAEAVPEAANEVIGARCATAEEAEALGIKRGAPVLTMIRTACVPAARAGLPMTLPRVSSARTRCLP